MNIQVIINCCFFDICSCEIQSPLLILLRGITIILKVLIFNTLQQNSTCYR